MGKRLPSSSAHSHQKHLEKENVSNLAPFSLCLFLFPSSPSPSPSPSPLIETKMKHTKENEGEELEEDREGDEGG